MSFESLLANSPVAGFVGAMSEGRRRRSGPPAHCLLLNPGAAVLVLTPYARSPQMLYFVFAERNRKYAAFTAVVCGTLTYSLYLRQTTRHARR